MSLTEFLSSDTKAGWVHFEGGQVYLTLAPGKMNLKDLKATSGLHGFITEAESACLERGWVCHVTTTQANHVITLEERGFKKGTGYGHTTFSRSMKPKEIVEEKTPTRSQWSRLINVLLAKALGGAPRRLTEAEVCKLAPAAQEQLLRALQALDRREPTNRDLQRAVAGGKLRLPTASKG